MVNLVVVLFSPVVTEWSSFEGFGLIHCDLVVGRQFAYVSIDFVIKGTLCPEFGAHGRYWEEVMPPSWSAAYTFVSRFLYCSQGRCCQLWMHLVQCTVEVRLETIVSVGWLDT